MTDVLTAPAITEKVTLGQAVLFSAIYYRQRVGNKRTWLRAAQAERRGVVVGTRTLWDGEVYTEYVDNGDDEKGYSSTFMQDSHKPALLVAFALNRKPVLVPVTDVIAAE